MMLRRFAHRYFDAKSFVIQNGYADEIDWQEDLDPCEMTESHFLREAAWVILASGISEAVVRNKFNAISRAFCGWRSAAEICANERACIEAAEAAFNHQGKLASITKVARHIDSAGFEATWREVEQNRDRFLTGFDYIGPTTSAHLLKNLGFDLAKNDRHLARIADAMGYDSAQHLCSCLGDFIGERVSVVDIVLWRFATLRPDYVEFLSG